MDVDPSHTHIDNVKRQEFSANDKKVNVIVAIWFHLVKHIIFDYSFGELLNRCFIQHSCLVNMV